MMSRKLKKIKKKQNAYVANSGGILAIRESDDVYNDFNREMLVTFKEESGSVFVGKINFYGKQRERVAAGVESVYTEYIGQPIYNFACDFAVPKRDETLERLIREWNNAGGYMKGTHLVDAIHSRVEELGGLIFVWF